MEWNLISFKCKYIYRQRMQVKFAGSGAIGWTLVDDETYEGDLYLGGGVLDLNGMN